METYELDEYEQDGNFDGWTETDANGNRHTSGAAAIAYSDAQYEGAL